jgi:predicted AAA+ superfamily ATPase
MLREDSERLLLETRSLAVMRGVFDSPAGRALAAFLELLSSGREDTVAVADAFGLLWRELSGVPEPLLPDAWRSYLVGRVLEDENPFSLAAERGEVGPALTEQTRRELRTLRRMFALGGEGLVRLVEEAAPELAGSWVPPRFETDSGGSPREEAARMLAGADDWAGCLEALAEHFSLHGAGAFGRYRAFRWREGRLAPVESPDPVRLAELIGYEREREPLLRNTRHFLAGLPAQHALLYGLPGTGKSSTVKAILNEYAGEGLRLVEVAKEDLAALPLVIEELRGRSPRFLVFVDDLSFEEHEVEYKTLKALLEGSVEEPPRNVRLYATSNRRNLIRESFSERGGDDVHARDTMQEKLSLAARFGLRVTFHSPDQREYLNIVAGLAGERGLNISGEELTERALLWERWHAGRSGRTARQFVDELEAELADRD